MSLENILLDVSADLGLDITEGTDERRLAVTRINQAASELYDSADLIGCLREQVFDVNTGLMQVALPYYVGALRGVRYYESTSRQKITIQDIRSRYASGIGNEVYPMRWHLMQNKSPLSRNLDNQSALTVSIPLKLAECFIVTINGRTPNSHRVSEDLKFCPGTTVMTTVNIWKDIESIRKDSVTMYDVTVSDADGNVVSMIPNIRKPAQFTLIQVLDCEITNFFAVEILFKLQFMPFVNDEDEYAVGHSSYDKAIYYKYLEHEYIRNKDVDGAIAARAKCMEVVAQVKENFEAGTQRTMDFAPNAYFGMYPSLVRSFRH